MAVDKSSKLIAAGRPGGSGGNKVASKDGDRNAIRKSRPASGVTAGPRQSTGTRGDSTDPTRKARPKSSGSGQTTNTK